MRRLSTVAVVAAALLPAACGNGETILNAGNEPATTLPVEAPATLPPGDTLPPGETTPPGETATAGDDTPSAEHDHDPVGGARRVPGRRARRGVSETVELTFWHGLNAESETALTKLTDAYNASQSRVHVELQNQGNYSQTIDKYVQSSQSSRPDVVMFPEYVVQQIADSDSRHPDRSRAWRQSGYDTSTFQPSTLTAYSTGGVQFGMPFAVSNPVLYYLKNVFEEAGLDPDVPPSSLEEVRQYSQQIVDSGAASLRNRRRQWHRFGWRLVPRAVVRQRRRALRRQRQRSTGAGDAGALRRRTRRRVADLSCSS